MPITDLRESQEIRTRALQGKFGAEILGVDLAAADEATCRRVVEIARRHGVILLRGQKLTPEDQIRFTRLFGEPAENIRDQYTLPGYPEIFVISNKVVDGRKIGDMDAGSGWHSDMVHVENPADVTILYALEVPKEGSDTLFADLCAAWNELPRERQAELEGRQIHHSYEHLGKKKGYNLTPEQLKKAPDVWHPIVRRHPADGRKALYICLGTAKGVTGMANEEGIKLVEELVAHSTQERFMYRHKWQAGDVLVWDNACTLHRATPFDAHNDVRLVYRTWVQGQKPIGA